MSRLQEYLKTPNPVHPEFFIFQNYQQENANDLFPENDGHLTKGPDQSSFLAYPRSPLGLLSIKKTPMPNLVSLDEQKIIQQRLKFDDISEQQMQTPMGPKQKNLVLHTTANKKYDLRITGTILQPPIDSKEGERTLRVLTAQAYDVVCRRGPITYKLVSQEIINDTCDLLSNKEQNNIKRRVYDALNVLIALGKLEKKGRKIFPNKNFEVDKANRQKLNHLKKTLLQKQAAMKAKMKYQKNLVRKNLMLKKLLARNKNNQQKNEKIQKIRMPFLISSYQNFKKMNQNLNVYTKVILKENKDSTFYGDLDALEYLKLPNK